MARFVNQRRMVATSPVGCIVTVFSGMEHLEPPNTRELDMGLADG